MHAVRLQKLLVCKSSSDRRCHAFNNKSYGTTTGYSARFNVISAQEFFSAKPRLQDKRKNGKLLFMFFDGPAGTGKKDLLKRLSTLGYQVRVNSFLDIAKEQPTWSGDHRGLMSLSYRFLQKTYDTIRRTEEEFENGDKFKDNLVFFSRSPLSPFLYSKSPVFLEAMVDVNKTFSCSVLLCKTDPTQVQQRLATRAEFEKQTDPDTQKLRTLLGEYDLHYLKEKEDAYEKLLLRTDYPNTIQLGIDGQIHTTSIKQAAAAVLGHLGLKSAAFGTSSSNSFFDSKKPPEK